MEKKIPDKLKGVAEALTGAMAIPVEAAAKKIHESKEKRDTKAATKERNEARAVARTALKEALRDIGELKKINDQKPIMDVSSRIIKDLDDLIERMYKWSPVSMVQALTEYRDKWEDDDTSDTESENIAQQELVNKEIQRCRDIAVDSFRRAIDFLKPLADETELSENS